MLCYVWLPGRCYEVVKVFYVMKFLKSCGWLPGCFFVFVNVFRLVECVLDIFSALQNSYYNVVGGCQGVAMQFRLSYL